MKYEEVCEVLTPERGVCLRFVLFCSSQRGFGGSGGFGGDDDDEHRLFNYLGKWGEAMNQVTVEVRGFFSGKVERTRCSSMSEAVGKLERAWYWGRVWRGCLAAVDVLDSPSFPLRQYEKSQ